MKQFPGRRTTAAAALVVLANLAAAGCGGSGSGSGSGSGQLTVLMADAPPSLAGVTAVNVTVSQVEVHTSSGGWQTVFQGSKTFNLLALANVQDVTTLPHLVDGGLAPGHYDQLRLVVASGTIGVNGQTQPLVIPSGANTGLKALPFDVASRQDTVLLLDFDVAQSVTLQGDGTYKLQPVIRLAPVTQTASVTGKIVDGSGAPMSAQVTLKDTTGAVVAMSITTVGASPSPTDGVFAVHGLPSGNYTLEVAAAGMPTVDQPVTLTAPAMTDAGNVLMTAGP
jgi:hypothetical protein